MRTISSSNFYVYEYVRLDTNEPFYIGKGKGNRWRDLRNGRSKYFKNIINKAPIAVVILHENLTNDEANKIECWYIWQLRDIQGYDLINMSDGGEGGIGGDMISKLTKEEKENWRNKISVASKKGWQTMNKENRNKIKNAVSKTHKNKKVSLETKNKISEKLKGGNNPRSKKAALIKDNKIIKEFNSLRDLANYAEKNFTKPYSYSYIKKCNGLGLQFNGFYIKYI